MVGAGDVAAWDLRGFTGAEGTTAFGSAHRNRSDAAADLQVSDPPGRWFLAFARGDDWPRAFGARSHDALNAGPAARPFLRRMPTSEGLHLIIDNSELSIVGEG